MPYQLLAPVFWSIWYNYHQKYLGSLFQKSLLSFRAPEASIYSGYVPASCRDKKQVPRRPPSGLLSSLTFPPDIIQVHGLQEALQQDHWRRQRVPAPEAFSVCTLGTDLMHTLGVVTGVNEICWVWPWRALKVCGPWLFFRMMFTSQVIPVCPNLPPSNFKPYCSACWTQQEIIQGNAWGNGM